MGLKGSGKTKQLIEMVREAIDEEAGDVVVIEKGQKLKHDIPHTVRLTDASPFKIGNYEYFKGFISGVFSANYDITHIFIDSITKVIGVEYDDNIEDFLKWCEEFSARENVKFTLTISADLALATEGMKKYF
jgi:rRNA maturation protein Rpf1